MTKWALLVALTGCNWVFGLDETVPADDEGLVNGTYHVHWGENIASGEPVVRDGVYAADELVGEVVLDDGTRRDVTIRGDGTFSFPTARAGQAYSLTFRSPAGRTTYQLAATNLALVDRVAGRRDRELVRPGTVLEVDVANRPPSTLTYREEIMTTGVWTRTQVSDQMPIRYDFATAVPATAPVGLIDGARSDDAYYIYFDRAGTYSRVVASARARGTLVNGQGGTLTATAAPLAADLCTQLALPSKQERDRLFGLLGNATSSLAVWAIAAAPAPELASIAQLPVAYAAGSVDDADVSSMVMYGNPFIGGVRVVQFGVVANTPEGDFASVVAHVPVQADCTTPTAIDAGVVAVPSALALTGTQIRMKGQFVTIDRSAPVYVSWLSSSGHADDTIVTLYEVVDTVGVLGQAIVTTGGHVTIDSADLEMGHTYFIIIQHRDGIPGAGSGDYSTVADAPAVGVYQSPTFTIAN
jgi:hypothetical protein